MPSYSGKSSYYLSTAIERVQRIKPTGPIFYFYSLPVINHNQAIMEKQLALATPYQDRCAQKRADQHSLILPEWRLNPIPSIESAPNALAYLRQILSPEELALTEETDIAVLLRKLASGEISSLHLTRVFAKRAALAHQLTTCCTEIFFEEAFAVAQEMDNHLAKTGQTVGPLHGLPVSIKDLFSVQGVDTSIGNIPFSTTRGVPLYTNQD